jgi:uncharacterized damage-inducible protein DinB
MLTELTSQFAAMEERRKALIEHLDALTEEQRRFHPKAKSWSPIEVADHLVLVEEALLTCLIAAGTETAPRKTFTERFMGLAVGVVFRFGFRAKIPVEEVRPRPDVDFEDLQKRWIEARERLREKIDSVTESSADKPFVHHPVAGPLSAAVALDFVIRHHDHHMRQMARIEASPAYPKENGE